MELVKVSNSQPESAQVYFSASCDIRGVIFGFIGINKDLASCRFVCKEWKGFIQKYLEQIYSMTKYRIENLRPTWEELHKSMSLATKDMLEVAKVRKAIYQSSDKNVFLRSIKMLAKINSPSKSIREGVLAVMYLLVDEEDLCKIDNSLDWKYFRKKLLDRKFLKSLRAIKPEDITQAKINKFEAALGLETITEYDQMYASAEARNVYLWATNIVEYKQFLDTLTQQVTDTIKQCEIQKSIEKDFEHFQSILNMTLCK